MTELEEALAGGGGDGGGTDETGSASRTGECRQYRRCLEALEARCPSRPKAWASNTSGRRNLRNAHSGPWGPLLGRERAAIGQPGYPGPSGHGLPGRPAPQSSPDGRPGPQEALEGPVGRGHRRLSPGAQHRGCAGGLPPPPPRSPRPDPGLPGLPRRRNPRPKSQLLRGG